jgi:ATP synthase F1 delta subunit
MLITFEMVAKKYAQAFVHVYGKELAVETFDQIRVFEDFLATQRGILLALTLAALSTQVRDQLVQKIVQQFQLPHHVQRLIAVLIQHKRLVLLRSVLKNIRKMYAVEQGIMDVSIGSSHPLEAAQRQHLCAFAQAMSGAKKIKASFVLMPEMISGIRIKSDTYLWEQSIRKLLHHVQQTMTQQVGL